MKKVALLDCLAMLCVGTALAQRDRDPDVPELKRRPAAEQHRQDANSPGESRDSAQQEEPVAASAQEPEPAPPTRPRLRRDSLGFDARSTEIRVLTTRSGGVIRVLAADPDDAELVGKIGIRLRVLAAQFGRGDFNLERTERSPATGGAATLREMRNRVTYTAHSIEDGAELIVASQEQRAVTAIHQFLQSQMREAGRPGSAAVRRKAAARLDAD